MPNSRSLVTRTILVALVVVLVGLLLLLVGSVENIRFQPRAKIELALASGDTGPAPESERGIAGYVMFLRVLFALSSAVFLIGVIVNRRFRRVFLTLAALAVALTFLVELLPDPQPAEPQEEVQETSDAVPEQAILPEPPQPEYEATSSQYVVLAIALSALVAGGAAFFLIRWLARTKPEVETFDELYDSLSDAAARIRAGEDPYTVVLFCYQEMIRILSAKGRIDATYLTPREFEQRLRVAGLSDSHIRQLTEIFEVVRYGSRVDDTFAQRALTCLDAIQEANPSQ